jgi:hypothetical protein
MVQEADQNLINKKFESKQAQYAIADTPEILLGAWVNVSKSFLPPYGYFYFTSHYAYVTGGLKVILPGYAPLPGEHRRRQMTFNKTSDSEWGFLATEGLASWKEGRIRLINKNSIEISEWYSDVEGKADQIKTTYVFKRIEPRPGPNDWDYFSGNEFPPASILGNWQMDHGQGQIEEFSVKADHSGKQALIEFGYAEPSKDLIVPTKKSWAGGKFVSWGPRSWWYWNETGNSRNELLFELKGDGKLRVTFKVYDDPSNPRHGRIASTKLYYRKG